MQYQISIFSIEYFCISLDFVTTLLWSCRQHKFLFTFNVPNYIPASTKEDVTNNKVKDFPKEVNDHSKNVSKPEKECKRTLQQKEVVGQLQGMPGCDHTPLLSGVSEFFQAYWKVLLDYSSRLCFCQTKVILFKLFYLFNS